MVNHIDLTLGKVDQCSLTLRALQWSGKCLSYREKMIFLFTCVASIPAYLMSLIKYRKWAINSITSQMAHFFWGNLGNVHKYHLAHWGLVTRKKIFGGL